MYYKLTLFFVLVLQQTYVFSEQQVPLCSCSQASFCASEGTKQLDNCKKECAQWLNMYGKPEPLTGCFWADGGIEGERLTNCMKGKIANFCVDGSQKAMQSNPDYNQWMETLNNSTETGKSGGAFIRKARSAFIVFRSFQKCMNNCAKRHSTKCFQDASCAISLPSDRESSLSIYNQCTYQNAHKDARESCRCLIQSHKVYSLVGICPLMTAAVMTRV